MQNEESNVFVDAPIIHQGERNDTLYKLGCALRGKQGMERNTIAGILLEYNAGKCSPPLDTTEVLSIVESACQHPAEIGAKKSAKRLEQNPLYWYQFNTREWFSDQNLMLMNDAQTGWYIRLLALAWTSGGFLPADSDKLWKLARAKSRKIFERDRGLVLAEYEEVEVDGERKLKHSKLAAQYAHTLQEWMKKKEAGEASKAARLAAFQSNQNSAAPADPQSLTVQ